MTSAAILAGGHARRLGGRDKSQITVGGRTILERQLDALHGLVTRILLIGYPGTAPGPGTVTVVPDRTPEHGPLGGLDAALVAAGDDHVLLLACDMPHVTRPFLEYLVGQAGSADAVVPETERGYHPLCAVYAQSSRPAVERRLRDGRLKMVDLLADLRVQIVTQADMERFGDTRLLLANVNTHADLAVLDSLQGHNA